jgi:hypothetical protein
MVGSSSLSGITDFTSEGEVEVEEATAKFSRVPSSSMRRARELFLNYFGLKLVYMPNMRCPGASGLSLKLQKTT